MGKNLFLQFLVVLCLFCLVSCLFVCLSNSEGFVSSPFLPLDCSCACVCLFSECFVYLCASLFVCVFVCLFVNFFVCLFVGGELVS